MRRALFAGTFDPVTLGHQDILAQADAVFDEVFVLVAVNAGKAPLFSQEERIKLWCKVTDGSRVIGPLLQEDSVVESAQRIGARTIVRGIRNLADMDEAKAFQAFVRQSSRAGMNVVYFMPSPTVAHVSSSGVKQLLAIPDGRRNLAGWLDPRVASYVADRS